MDRPVSGRDNFYFEMESVKKEAEAGIYDDVVCAISTKPKSSENFPQGREARQTRDSIEAINAFHSHTAVVRRLLCISVAVVTVAFLTAAATLVLALFMMMSRTNDMTASSNDHGPVQESKLSQSKFEAELKAIKENISTIQSRAANKMVTAELEMLKTRIRHIEEKISSSGGSNISEKNQEQNKTELKIEILKAVNANVNGKLKNVQQGISKLEQTVKRVSKDPGPPGPRGYNGTNGLPGRPGFTNLTLCSYQKAASAGESPETYAREVVQKTEPNGKKFLGVYCDSNDAKFITMSSTISGGKRTYQCTCENTLRSGDSKMYCNIHYWECQG